MALYLCQKSREQKKQSAHAQLSLSHVNYSVSRVQISTASRTSLIFAHTFSNRVKQRQVRVSKKQQPCTTRLCSCFVHALSLLCARSRWSSARSKQTLDIFGAKAKTKADPGRLVIGHFPAPPQFPADDSFLYRQEAQWQINR